MGLGQTEQFQCYHRVLNRATWSGREASRVLLGLLVKTFVPSGPLVIGVDETLERRWGKKIAAKGVYRYLRYVPPMTVSSKRAACGGCA
jgi:DDE superfamily endonuclease